MSFLSSNWFLALTAFVNSYSSLSVSVQATASGWVYQTIEWLIVFSLAFCCDEGCCEDSEGGVVGVK